MYLFTHVHSLTYFYYGVLFLTEFHVYFYRNSIIIYKLIYIYLLATISETNPASYNVYIQTLEHVFVGHTLHFLQVLNDSDYL